MTQKRRSNLVFSGALVAVTGFWLWFLFAHADQIFRATQYLSRASDRDRLRAVFLFGWHGYCTRFRCRSKILSFPAVARFGGRSTCRCRAIRGLPPLPRRRPPPILVWTT